MQPARSEARDGASISVATLRSVPSRRPPRGSLLGAACVLAVLLAIPAPAVGAASAAPARTSGGWMATWTTGLVPPTGQISARSGATAGFRDQTYREVVHVSAGGSAVRLRFSNAFGRAPLTIGAVSVAAQELGPAIEAVVAVGFAGGRGVTIPRGGEATSRPVPFTVEPGANLAVSMFFPGPTGPLAWHYLALVTSWSTPADAGDHTLDQTGNAFPLSAAHWYVLSGVDVPETAGRAVVVAFGDSITDGFGASGDGHHRWPDILWSRLEQAGYPLAVVNAGIGKNRVLADDPGMGGPSAISRLRHDALDQPGARTVILLEGINDVFAGATSAAIIGGMRAIVAETHAAGLTIVGGTLTPVCRRGPREQRRQAVNAFVRSRHAFDGVVDFARAVEDPAAPGCLQSRYDSGDHVHPNDAGYAAMAAAVDLSAVDTAAGAGAPEPARPLAPVALLLVACAGAVIVVLRHRRATVARTAMPTAPR